MLLGSVAPPAETPGAGISPGLMLKASKSLAALLKSSVTRKLPNQRRKYPPYTETPFDSSCCALTENSQLYGRLPHPNRAWSSPDSCEPGELRNSGPVAVPHVSTWLRFPARVGPCAAGFVRSQSGMKLWLLSTHARVPVRVVTNGLSAMRGLLATSDSPSTYFEMFTLIAVFPSPVTAQAAAIFGVMSF